MPKNAPFTRPSWIEVPSAALRGEGLMPYEQGEVTNLFDWVENPNGSSSHIMPYVGQFLLDVVQIDDNAVHQPSKPGDEIVFVLSGSLILTDDNAGKEMRVEAGEAVLIPEGWAGMYRVKAGKRPFLELAIVPSDYFQQSISVLPSGRSPRLLEVSQRDGLHEFRKGQYRIETQAFEGHTSWTASPASDEIAIVLSGSIEISDADRSAVIVAPGAFVLPSGSSAELTAHGGTRLARATWP